MTLSKRGATLATHSLVGMNNKQRRFYDKSIDHHALYIRTAYVRTVLFDIRGSCNSDFK